jgi:hypothetical protein
LLIRRIRGLLYEQGFTISGARNRLIEPATGLSLWGDEAVDNDLDDIDSGQTEVDQPAVPALAEASAPAASGPALSTAQIRLELISIRSLLTF